MFLQLRLGRLPLWTADPSACKWRSLPRRIGVWLPHLVVRFLACFYLLVPLRQLRKLACVHRTHHTRWMLLMATPLRASAYPRLAHAWGETLGFLVWSPAAAGSLTRAEVLPAALVAFATFHSSSFISAHPHRSSKGLAMWRFPLRGCGYSSALLLVAFFALWAAVAHLYGWLERQRVSR